VSNLDIKVLERLWEGREEDRKLERALDKYVKKIG
jgi:hypothetical protein